MSTTAPASRATSPNAAASSPLAQEETASLSPDDLAAIDRAECAAREGLLADLGTFWGRLFFGFGVSAVITLWLSLFTLQGAAAFGAAMLWYAAMLSTWGIIGATIGSKPRSRAKMALAIAAVTSKLALFALAILAVATTLQVVWNQGLAPYILAGLLSIPVLSMATWIATRRLANRFEQLSRRRRSSLSMNDDAFPRGPHPASSAPQLIG